MIVAPSPPRTRKFHLNRIHLMVELLLRRPDPTNIPTFCMHEPTTGCNLRCPACPTGAGINNVKETATLEDYETVCREFGPYLDVYYLFNWGEATMSRQLPAILARLNQEPFTVHLASNFSLPLSDALLDILATMPRLSLQIDVDGVTQETHERSRVRSKLSVVLDNARRLSGRVRTSPAAPFDISFGYLDFDYNAGERAAVQQMAEDLGFRFSPIGEPLVAGQPPERGEIDLNAAFGCTSLYSMILPSPKLTRLAPCCGVWDGGQMSARDPSQSLHEAFMHDGRYQARRTLDAQFARLPVETRQSMLQDNVVTEDGMALRQSQSAVDICQRCSMGNSYQAKLPRIGQGAIDSLALLTRSDAKTASARINALARRIGASSPSRDAGFVERLVATLDMPPAAARGIGSYAAFAAVLEL